jgi:hypothetical protein
MPGMQGGQPATAHGAGGVLAGRFRFAHGPIKSQNRRRKMNRKEAKREVEKIIAASLVKEHIHQRKPWTCYSGVCRVNGREYELLDFSKVIHPDVWDAHYGYELAKKKAVASVAKVILYEFSQDYDCPPAACPYEYLIEKLEGKR